MKIEIFDPSTKLIQFEDSSFVTSLFRKIFFCGRQHGTVKIAAEGLYVIYINGRRVIQRGIKSYDFHKYYDVVDISRFIKIGDNCIAVESTGAFMAEIESEHEIICVTDSRFSCIGNAAYKIDTLGHSITLGKEEWFDSNKERADWMCLGYEEKDWVNAVEIGGVKKWSGYTRYRAEFLTNTPLYGKCIVAELLSRRTPGVKMNLTSRGNGVYPEGKGGEIQVYLTELVCQIDTEIGIYVKNTHPRISIDGIEYTLGKKRGLSKGSHILCISTFDNCEVHIDAPFTTICAKALCGEESIFSRTGFSGKMVRYPWHESGEDITGQVPELNLIHRSTTIDQITSKVSLYPAVIYGESALAEIQHQKYYLPVGGICPPQLFPNQEIINIDVNTPFKNAKHLLQISQNFCQVDVKEDYDATCIIDLGKETCGTVFFSIEAMKGQIIDVQCFEVIDGEGAYIMENHNGFRYIARDGYQEYTSMSRYGCRYIQLNIRNKGIVKIYDFHMNETIYPVNRKAGFQCNDILLNQIYKMCVDTASLCMLDTYVDCPGHEQNFWVGDANITAKNNLLNFGEYEFNQHNISFVGQSLSEEFVRRYYPNDERYLNGKFLSIGAFDAYPEGGLPMWSYLWVQQIWEHYVYSGNKEMLAENYEYLKKNLANSQRMINSRGLFDMQGAWNLIEWGFNDLSAYGEVTANNVFLVNSFRIASKIAAILERMDESAEYQKKAERLFEKINLLCWDEARQAYVDTVRDEYSYERYCEFYCQQNLQIMTKEDFLSCNRISEQSNTLALLYDCVPEERIQTVLHIARRVEDGQYRFGSPAGRSVGQPKEWEVRDGIVMVGSPYFLYFSLGTLFRHQMAQSALKVIRRDWGKMLEKGVNTCWETFEMSKTKYTRSICHAWSAAPSIYLLEEILGIKPIESGYKKFVIKPQLGDLIWVQGSVATPYGNIYARVEKQEDNTYKVIYKAPIECSRVLNMGAKVEI